MSTPLRIADQSQNMEDLRNARSYNDMVVVLSRIMSTSSTIQSKVSRLLLKVSDMDLDIDSGEIQFDRGALRSVHKDLSTLEINAYEVKFARSILHIVPSDDKLAKLNVLFTKIDNNLVKAKNLCFKYLNEIGKRLETEKLQDYYQFSIKVLSKSLPQVRLSSFVMPDDGDKTSIVRYIVLRGLVTKGGYTVPEFLIALHARNNYDDSYSYLISFPVKPRDGENVTSINSKAKLDRILRDKLSNLFDVKKVKSISTKTRRPIELLSSVRSVVVEKGEIRLNLESGVTGSDINHILSRCLPLLHSAFGIKDPRLDVLHRVGVSQDGSKTISFLVANRNFHDRKSLEAFRDTLRLGNDNYTNLLHSLDD